MESYNFFRLIDAAIVPEINPIAKLPVAIDTAATMITIT